MAKNNILKFQDGSYGYVDLPASLKHREIFLSKKISASMEELMTSLRMYQSV